MHYTVAPSTLLTFGSAHLQPVTGAASFTLNDTILRAWYTDSNVYAYRVQNLRLEDPYSVSPCDSGTSRWRRTTGVCSAPTTTINAATLTTLTAALSTSTDVNPFVRDITLTGGSVCTDAADETVGAQIEVLISGVTECFQHVHPNEDDVRDFSLWAIIHPGNVVAEANNRCVVGGGPRPPIPFFIFEYTCGVLLSCRAFKRVLDCPIDRLRRHATVHRLTLSWLAYAFVGRIRLRSGQSPEECRFSFLETTH